MTMTTEKKSDDEGKTCIVLIGSTGCGKSTLTNILSKANVKTSDSGKSCTKECKIYNVNKTTTLMDTPGFEDTDKSFSDIEIIKKMTTKLGKAKSPKIKIIWCIKPNNKMIPKLQLQARLINALGKDVWKSVVIICRKANMLDEEDNWIGVRDAAAEYYKTSSKIPFLGITNVSVMKKSVQERCAKRSFTNRKEDGYFFSDEIKSYVFGKLKDIPSSKAKLKKIYEHASVSLKHVYSWSSTAISRQVTRNKTECPGCNNNPERCIYALRSVRHGTWYCHTTGCHRQINVGDIFYHCWPCCDRKKHKNKQYVVGCRGFTCKYCAEQTYTETVYEGAYPCCLSTSSTGCVTSCCGKNPSLELTEKCGEIKYEPEGL